MDFNSWFSGTLDVQDFNRGIQVDLDTRIPIGKSAIVFFLDFGFRMKDSLQLRYQDSGSWNREMASTGIPSFEQFQTFFNLYQ
ncbi:unnamed protein product [Rhizophagus irregularis]|nr:unnamed protein product [Rhizophagus irregularis]